MTRNASLEALTVSLPGKKPRLVFALHNRGDEPRRVPIPIGSPGYLVHLRIFGTDGPVWESRLVKVKMKLDPDLPTSYRDLDPGIIHGTVFELDGLGLQPGHYRVEAQYTNGRYVGPADDPIGKLALFAATELRIG